MGFEVAESVVVVSMSMSMFVDVDCGLNGEGGRGGGDNSRSVVAREGSLEAFSSSSGCIRSVASSRAVAINSDKVVRILRRAVEGRRSKARQGEGDGEGGY